MNSYIKQTRWYITNSKRKARQIHPELFIKMYIDELEVEDYEEPDYFKIWRMIEDYIKSNSWCPYFTEIDFYRKYRFDDWYIKEDLAKMIWYKQNHPEENKTEDEMSKIMNDLFDNDERIQGEVKKITRVSSLDELRISHHWMEEWQNAKENIKITPWEKKMLEWIVANLRKNKHLSHINKQYYHAYHIVWTYNLTWLDPISWEDVTWSIDLSCELDRIRFEDNKWVFVPVETIPTLPLEEKRQLTMWIRDYKSTWQIEKCEYQIYEWFEYADQVAFYMITALIAMDLVEASKLWMKIRVVIDFMSKKWPSYAYEPREIDKSRLLERVRTHIKPSLDEIVKYMTTKEYTPRTIWISERKELYNNPYYTLLDSCVLEWFNQLW